MSSLQLESDWDTTALPRVHERMVVCVLDKKFNAKKHTDTEIHAAAGVVWEARQAENPRIFNGTKFRLHSFSVVDGRSDNPGDSSGTSETVLILNLGITDYKSYLGTNSNPSIAARLQKDGVSHYGDRRAFLSQKLGVGGVTITTDGYIACIVRSAHVAEAQGMVDVPGGHPEPCKVSGVEAIFAAAEVDEEPATGPVASKDDHREKVAEVEEHDERLSREVTREFFGSVLDEIVDEVNVPAESLEQPCLLGIVWQKNTAGTPSAAFTTRCSLSRAEVEAQYALGAREAFESTALRCVDSNALLTAALRANAAGTQACDADERQFENTHSKMAAADAVSILEQSEIAPMRFTAATRGCLSLWVQHQVNQKIVERRAVCGSTKQLP